MCDCKSNHPENPVINGIPMHDRLDLKQTSLEFTAPTCGSLRRDNGQPDYCCYDCPTLLAKHSATPQ
jgi:hypothetical protein